MNESSYWWELSLRLNSQDRLEPQGYCDGFNPKRYVFAAGQSHIAGKVTFVDGSRAAAYTFKLWIGSEWDNLDQVLWERLLPPEDAADWWSVDVEYGKIDMYPTEA